MKRVCLPRDAVLDRMMMQINGTSEPNGHRFGHLNRERATKTLDMFKVAAGTPMTEEDMSSDTLKKSVSIATGLTYYDLRAPALNLFPTVTPLRNSVGRAQRPNPGDAAHWKSVLATTGSGFPYMGWVPEGQRSASMSYTVQQNTLPYATLGEEDDLSDEARFAAQGFEDEDALVQLRLLLKMFVKEEAAILGGNASLVMGAPSAPTLASATNAVTTGTLASATYSVRVVGLTQEGYLNSSMAGGVATVLNITGNDGKAYTLNGGSSNISVAATIAVTLGQVLTASLPSGAISNNVQAAPFSGAVAYAWFAGPAGSETLQAITTTSIAAFSAPFAAGRQAATAVTGDASNNSGVAFDGFLTTAFKAGSNAYINALTPGLGLTSSGAGGVVEIDNALKTMWDTYRISPTVGYVNSQELKNITAKVLNGSSAPLLRYQSEADNTGMVEYKLTAAGVVSFYFNPFSADGGVRIPIKIHPNLAAGTILLYAERLPPWYVSNATPEVAQILTRQDYYAEVWPKTTRRQYYGIYAQEALAVYAPFGIGLITNIANV